MTLAFIVELQDESKRAEIVKFMRKFGPLITAVGYKSLVDARDDLESSMDCRLSIDEEVSSTPELEQLK